MSETSWLHLTIPDIKRHWHKKKWLLVPGGWQAKVPQVSTTEAVIQAYSNYFASDGMGLKAAREKTCIIMQERFNYGFLITLKLSIMGYAETYAQMFPEHRVVHEQFKTGNTVIVLRGYKPEIMQAAYVPGQRPGKHGLAYAKNMLREMGNSV